MREGWLTPSDEWSATLGSEHKIAAKVLGLHLVGKIEIFNQGVEEIDRLGGPVKVVNVLRDCAVKMHSDMDAMSSGRTIRWSPMVLVRIYTLLLRTLQLLDACKVRRGDTCYKKIRYFRYRLVGMSHTVHVLCEVLRLLRESEKAGKTTQTRH